MFIKMINVDLKRGFSPIKLVITVILINALMYASCWEELKTFIMELRVGGALSDRIGAIDLLEYQMGFDSFKVVIVILMSGLYTGSYCIDKKSRYLRAILSRAELQSYVLSRFLANTIVITAVSVLCCYIFSAGVMLLGFPVISRNGEGGYIMESFYRDVMLKYPYLYIAMIGMQFGMVVAALSSIGMLFSVYQPDKFVSIGLSAFLFFLAASSPLLQGNCFDVLHLIGMYGTLSTNGSVSVIKQFGWGMLYPGGVIVVCCLLFYRRMKWRMVNGFL